MRIALLTDGIWPDKVGGMQKHSYYLAKYLSLNHIKVDLYYCADDEALVINQFSVDEALNIQFFRIKYPVMWLKLPGHYLWDSYNYSRNMYNQFVQQPSVDFVYAQGFTGWYFAKKGVKLGSNLHGLEMFQKAFGFKSRLIQYLLKIPAKTIIQKSAICYSLGGKLTAILVAQKAKKIIETPIGIGEEWLKPNTRLQEKINFVFVGRNEKRKGLDNLFEVIQKMDSSLYNFHFIGIEKYTIIKDFSHLFFYGELKETHKIQRIMAQCDCLVCPSIAEGMPTVILEGMAMGMAIIATDTGATSLLVDKQNGLLIEPDNKETLLNSLNYFITINKDELLHLKGNSFKKVSEQYIWPVSIKTTIQALHY